MIDSDQTLDELYEAGKAVNGGKAALDKALAELTAEQGHAILLVAGRRDGELAVARDRAMFAKSGFEPALEQDVPNSHLACHTEGVNDYIYKQLAARDDVKALLQQEG